jgi:hypothetical protein
VAERVGEEPGDVHLGDAQLPGDLGLGQVTAEAQHQDLLLTGGQLAPVCGNGLEVEHVFQLRILGAQEVSQAERAGGPRVQRGWLQGQFRRPGVLDIVRADSQMPGEVGVGGGTAEFLGELEGLLAGLQDQFLQGPVDMDLPALVTEVPLDLAGDARLSLGGQGAAEGRVEVVDGLQQADVAHLHQVLGRLGAAPVSLHAQPDQAPVTAGQQLTAPHRAAGWLAAATGRFLGVPGHRA